MALGKSACATHFPLLQEKPYQKNRREHQSLPLLRPHGYPLGRREPV